MKLEDLAKTYYQLENDYDNKLKAQLELLRRSISRSITSLASFAAALPDNITSKDIDRIAQLAADLSDDCMPHRYHREGLPWKDIRILDQIILTQLRSWINQLAENRIRPNLPYWTALQRKLDYSSLEARSALERLIEAGLDREEELAVIIEEVRLQAYRAVTY